MKLVAAATRSARWHPVGRSTSRLMSKHAWFPTRQERTSAGRRGQCGDASWANLTARPPTGLAEPVQNRRLSEGADRTASELEDYRQRKGDADVANERFAIRRRRTAARKRAPDRDERDERDRKTKPSRVITHAAARAAAAIQR